MVYLIITSCCLVGVFLFKEKNFFLSLIGSRKILTKGREANAVLLNIQQTGILINNSQQVKLQIQVQPSIGRNFVSEISEVFNENELKQIQIGRVVKVKYNPANTKQILMIK